MADAEYTRLHITPFTPALLKTFLPASILPNARNISYHSIQTFPEKGYGYVELPTMDAEKIKQKLNGSILKGTKVKIEKARQEKEVVIEPVEPGVPKREKKKRKRDELPGVEIGERQVKRGWTTPAKDIAKSKDKKPVNKSKYTTAPECLFKTNLPPNVASKTKSVAEMKPEKRKKKAGKETVVHEFAKTTKYATFLRGTSGSNKSKSVAEYIEGKGWVDEEGNLVEEVITKKRKHKEPVPAPLYEARESSNDSEDSGESENESNIEAESNIPDGKMAQNDSSSDDSSDDSSSENSEESENEADQTEVEPMSIDAKVTENGSSSDDSSDDSSSEDEIEGISTKEGAKDAPESSDSSSSSDSDSSESSENESEVEEPQSAVSNRSHTSNGPALSIKIPVSNNSTPINTSVHPLEALYKRPKAGEASSSKPTPQSFSFFGADGDEEEVEDSYNQVPLTPFTQKDFEYRGMRSAAPTPDTAHPNKRFIWSTENDEEDEEDEEEPAASSPIRKGKVPESKETKEGEPETEFQKWFWENRGNVDRSWKARRRAVGKEKRQRENRKRQDRGL